MVRKRKDGQPDRRGSKPGQAGQPRHEPTKEQREFVKMATACGMPQASIGIYLDISPDTLQRHYRRELDLGTDEANVKVAGALFRMATDPKHPAAARAAEFWMRARGGWVPQSETLIGVGSGGERVPGPAGGAVPEKITVEFVHFRPKGLPGAPPEDR